MLQKPRLQYDIKIYIRRENLSDRHTIDFTFAINWNYIFVRRSVLTSLKLKIVHRSSSLLVANAIMWQGIVLFGRGNVRQTVLIYVFKFFRGFLKLVCMLGTHGPDS